MQIQFAAKKVGDVFEVALIVDGKFQRATTGKTIMGTFDKLVGPVLTSATDNGSEVAITIAIIPPEKVQ